LKRAITLHKKEAIHNRDTKTKYRKKDTRHNVSVTTSTRYLLDENV